MARLRILIVFAGAGLMLLAACGGQSTEPQLADEPVTLATSTTVTTSSSAPLPTSFTPRAESTDDFVPDYAALIAAVEGGMEGTAYEGAALEDVEVFVATAELFCDLRGEGMSTDAILTDYLDRLAAERAEDVDEDDGLMAGVVFGAAIEIVCPEYAEV